MTHFRWDQTIDGATSGAPGFFDGSTFDQTFRASYPALGAPWSADIGAAAQGYRAPAGALSINLATGQNAAGVIQLTGDMADANWTVSNAATYKQAPIAFTVAPGDRDWYSQWAPNGPDSSWIAANPDSSDNGNTTYTFTFNLTGYDPAAAILSGGQFKCDDAATVYLNGHAIGSSQFNGWTVFTALSNGAGDFVSGTNTLVIQTMDSDFEFEAARLEGSVIDSVSSGSGPVHWMSDVSGSFDTATNWKGGLVPGPNNGAILDAAGSTPYTVTASTSNTVESLQTATMATLDIAGGMFTVAAGGSNSGAIQVQAGASFSLGGTFSNQSVLATGINGEAGTATIYISQSATLKGGGDVVFGAATTNRIIGGGAATTLTNVDNTISGSGVIGGGDLTFVNDAKGVIDGGANGITIDASGGTDGNAGLIESAGGLTLQNGSFSNTGSVEAGGALDLNAATLDDTSGGIVEAVSGIQLTNSAILGGAVTLAAGTTLLANGADTLTAGVTNNGTVTIAAGAALSLQGVLTNDGKIRFDSGAASAKLIIGSGAHTITNAGVIVANGAGDLVTIESAVNNTGRLRVFKGTMTLDGPVNNTGRLRVFSGTMIADGAVTGSGMAVITGGEMEFASAFDESVIFSSGVGELALAQSQSFAAAITGFSGSGGTTLDCRDIGFINADEATFSGNERAGVLTVTDGTHTASIKLIGDYTTTTFVAANDGHGGVTVAAQVAALKFATAAATLGDGSAASLGALHASSDHARLTLAPPTSAALSRNGNFQLA